MSKNRLYLALGEEAQRGTAETVNVGFIPLLSSKIPSMEFDEKKRKEFRGEDSAKGYSAVDRFTRKWSATLEVPFYTEAGSVAGMMGTLLKHFFGHVASGQNGTTGQYYHMFSPVADPFGAANLDTRALTLNMNINEGDVMKNWPFVGGRVKSLSFVQEAGQQLKLSAEMFGQFRDTTTAEIGSPQFAPENVRCDYNNLTVWNGAISRTGTAPDYTDFAPGAAVRLKPDKLTLKIENGMEDVVRLSGLDYPDRTRMGMFKATMELTLDWEDPASGFSTVREFNDWVNSAGSTNFFLHWDTGTQAATGDNHSLYIDLPVMERQGGAPDYKLEKDPMITLKYEALLDTAATGYMAGLLLKNTAAAV